MNLAEGDGNRPSRRAADRAKSRILDLYDSEGSETDGVDQEQAAAGPAGPTPPITTPRRVHPHNNQSESSSDDYDDADDQEPDVNVPGPDDSDPDNPSADDMAEFEDVDEADAPEVMGKLASIKVPWDPRDIRYWFFEVELQMTLINVKSAWLKRVVLANNLPPDVRPEV